MWQVLKDHFQMSNPQALANLKSALENCRLQKGQALDAYIKNHEQLMNQLAAVRQPLSNIDRVVSFLSGLSERYDTLKTLYLNTVGLSYKDMIIGLRSFEASRAKQNDKGG